MILSVQKLNGVFLRIHLKPIVSQIFTPEINNLASTHRDQVANGDLSNLVTISEQVEDLYLQLILF